MIHDTGNLPQSGNTRNYVDLLWDTFVKSLSIEDPTSN